MYFLLCAKDDFRDFKVVIIKLGILIDTWMDSVDVQSSTQIRKTTQNLLHFEAKLQLQALVY